MRLIVFSFLFLLTPGFSVVAEEISGGDQPSVCIVSVPKSVFNLPEIALEKTKAAMTEAGDSVFGAVKALPEKADELALSLADSLEASKAKPAQAQVQEADATEAEVLGQSADSDLSLTASAYNAGVDVLGFLLRHWLWSVSGLGLAGLFFAFRP